jgi:hypothetical protein
MITMIVMLKNKNPSQYSLSFSLKNQAKHHETTAMNPPKKLHNDSWPQTQLIVGTVLANRLAQSEKEP